MFEWNLRSPAAPFESEADLLPLKLKENLLKAASVNFLFMEIKKAGGAG